MNYISKFEKSKVESLVYNLHTKRKFKKNMKRYGNLYSQIYDMENLRLAHKNAQKGKGWYKENITSIPGHKAGDELLHYQIVLIQGTYH